MGEQCEKVYYKICKESFTTFTCSSVKEGVCCNKWYHLKGMKAPKENKNKETENKPEEGRRIAEVTISNSQVDKVVKSGSSCAMNNSGLILRGHYTSGGNQIASSNEYDWWSISHDA